MLQLQQISKKYHGQRAALNRISLHLEKGDFCVLLGSNGSGKSTLLKTISGELAPDTGKVYLQQKDITNLPIHQRADVISSVLQDPMKGTVAQMTLLENLCLSLQKAKSTSLRMYQNDRAKLREKVAQLNVGLEDYMDKPLLALSGGQRQIIATLMATLTTPQLLLLDEHCSALDPKTQRLVMQLTNEIIAKENLTAIMITHHLPDAIEYGNRLIMLHQGNIVLDLNAKQKKALTIPKLLHLFHEGTLPHSLKEGATVC